MDLLRWICSDELWVTGIIRMAKLSYLRTYYACPAKQPSCLSYLSCTCKDYLYVCLISHTPCPFYHTFCVCMFAAFKVVLLHPRDHLTSQWSFSASDLCALCGVWDCFLFVFFMQTIPSLTFYQTEGFRRMWNHITISIKGKDWDGIRWTISVWFPWYMFHFETFYYLSPFWMLIDICLWILCLCMDVFSTSVYADEYLEWVETAACVSPVHFGELHMPLFFYSTPCTSAFSTQAFLSMAPSSG